MRYYVTVSPTAKNIWEKGWYIKTENILVWAWYQYNLKTCVIWGQNQVLLFPIRVSIGQEVLGWALTVSLTT